MKLNSLAQGLLIVGGLNWLLIGVMDLNVVSRLGSTVSQIVYILVGLAAIYQLAMRKNG